MNNSPLKNSLRLRLSSLFALLSLTFSLLPPTVKAQQTAPPEKTRELVADDKPINEKRLALVIGNSKYENVAPLKNAANDATDIAVALRDLGFEVIEGENLDKEGIEKLIFQFGIKLNKQGGVGLFFYAGHGVQYKGKNYLVPVNAYIPSEDEIDYRAIEIDLLIRKLDVANNYLNIVILDACRNNPFAKQWSENRDIGQDDAGLAKIAAPKGTILLYSTEPGKTASDGATGSRNGLFTEVLLGQIKKPNVEFDALYKTVAQIVSERSSQKQRPYKEANSYRDFYFAGTPAKPMPGRQAAVVPADESDLKDAKNDAKAREQEAWEAVKDSGSVEDFRIYLDGFPVGANAARAEIRIEQIAWNSIKKNDKAAIQNFLKEFPNGANATTARIKLRQLEPSETTAAAAPTEKAAPPAAVAAPKIIKSKVQPAPPVTKNKGKTEKKIETLTNSIGMELVAVPAGSFLMGLSKSGLAETWTYSKKEITGLEPDAFDIETLQRRITIAEGFLIGKTEVTQAQWTAVMDANPSNYVSCGGDCPVERVSWEDAKIFIQKLNEKNDGFEYRLPTEAEWEYAARGGTTGMFAGAIDLTAWHLDETESKTHPVAAKLPNAFGLYDMSGNVREWCEDVFSPTYEELPIDGSANAIVGDKNLRVVRGGSYGNLPTNMRSTARVKLRAATRDIQTGLRVVARQK